MNSADTAPVLGVVVRSSSATSARQAKTASIPTVAHGEGRDAVEEPGVADLGLGQVSDRGVVACGHAMTSRRLVVYRAA